MGKYRMEFRMDGQPVRGNITAPDMQAALRKLKRGFPEGTGFTVWSPDHVPPLAD